MLGYTHQQTCVLVAALYGSLFKRELEAAFCNYRMWESLGFIMAFGYSTFLCTSTKLYVVMATLVVGFLGYCILEWVVRQSSPEAPKIEPETQERRRSKDGFENKGFRADS